MPINDFADIVVIGGGPAGSAIAISAVGAGLRTVLLEAAEFPRARPGESLHPGIQPLIAQLGCEKEFLAAGFPRYSGVHVEVNGALQFDEFGSDENGPWQGFQAWRAELDEMLLSRSRSVGVDVRQPCRALRPLISGEHVVGIESSDGPVRARFVVDASGGKHWLARHLKLSISKYSPQLIARFGYSESTQTTLPLPCLIADDAGWTWHAEVRHGLFHWTRLDLDSNRSNHPAQRSMRPGERGADVTWRCIDRPAGAGYFILGDAGAVLDPASSHGVLRALMSGIMAAEVAQRVLKSPGEEESLLQAYCAWWNDWFQHDVRHLRAWYQRICLPEIRDRGSHWSLRDHTVVTDAVSTTD